MNFCNIQMLIDVHTLYYYYIYRDQAYGLWCGGEKISLKIIIACIKNKKIIIIKNRDPPIEKQYYIFCTIKTQKHLIR